MAKDDTRLCTAATHRKRSRRAAPLPVQRLDLCPIVLPPVRGDMLSAAQTLYRAMLDLIDHSDNPARDSHRLAAPLSRVVAGQKSRLGQAECALLARSLARRDHAGALAACRRLIALEQRIFP